MPITRGGGPLERFILIGEVDLRSSIKVLLELIDRHHHVVSKLESHAMLLFEIALHGVQVSLSPLMSWLMLC